MKKFLSMIVALVATCTVFAQNETADYISLEGLSSALEVGGTSQRVYVRLNGSSVKYTGYNMDLYLPYGLEFDVTNKGKLRVSVVRDIQPYTEDEEENEEGEMVTTKSYTHTFSFEDKGNGHLRVACFSSMNEDFTKFSGRLFSFYVKATSPYANPNAMVQVKGVALTTSDKVEYDPADAEMEGINVENGREIPLSISATAQWSTCILPFSAAIPEGVKAYTTEKNDEQYIYLKEAESLEAYTPYILYSETGYSGNISGTVAASGYPETGCVKSGYLCGAIVPQTVTEGYVLQKQTEGVKFYAIAEGDSFNIPAGKCWMQLSEDALAKFLGFKIEDTDGISTTVVPASKIGFDISGRQAVSHKGLLIKDGKKTLNP